MDFGKRKYLEYRDCPKAAWYGEHVPQARKVPPEAEKRIAERYFVGEIAKGFFGKFVSAAALTPHGVYHPMTVVRTQEFTEKGEETICDAGFSYENLHCVVDILHREGNGYALCEVTSSTSVKPRHVAALAYQKHVAELCGVKVMGAYVLHVNGDYVRKGEIDAKTFLQQESVWEAVCREQENVASLLKQAESYLAESEEPPFVPNERCGDCPFAEHCMRNLPHPNLFDSHHSIKIKLKHYQDHVLTLDELKDRVEAEYVAKHPAAIKLAGSRYLEKEPLREFLSELRYPLYFLDFETMSFVIPPYDGTWPNRQIPFQYSLHILEKEGAEPQHKEFLAESGADPRRAIAERLVEDIPEEVRILAYNKSFECGRIEELAEDFPDLAKRLRSIADRIVDLIVPFRKGYCFDRATCGSSSIKQVLPALFPQDPELDYHALKEVHNGGEATFLFPRIAQMPAEEAAAARRNLMAYCRLDTYAMVKILEKLRTLV